MKPSAHLHSRLMCAAAMALAGASLGCTNSDSRSGEIFLVSASGESSRLGLIEVFAVPPDAAPQDAIAAISDGQRRLNLAEKQLSLAKSTREAFGQQMRQRSDDMHASVKRERNLSEKAARLTAMADQAQTDASTIVRLLKAEKAASAARDESLQRLLDLWKGVVASPNAATKTDSDGAFSISCRKDDCICAYATRVVSEGTQHLIWIIEADKMPPAGKLLLSNDNLVALPGD
jgi:hypothetical protein